MSSAAKSGNDAESLKLTHMCSSNTCFKTPETQTMFERRTSRASQGEAADLPDPCPFREGLAGDIAASYDLSLEGEGDASDKGLRTQKPP